jgi:hypothetical protein
MRQRCRKHPTLKLVCLLGSAPVHFCKHSSSISRAVMTLYEMAACICYAVASPVRFAFPGQRKRSGSFTWQLCSTM